MAFAAGCRRQRNQESHPGSSETGHRVRGDCHLETYLRDCANKADRDEVVRLLPRRTLQKCHLAGKVNWSDRRALSTSPTLQCYSSQFSERYTGTRPMSQNRRFYGQQTSLWRYPLPAPPAIGGIDRLTSLFASWLALRYNSCDFVALFDEGKEF
jgi:hypothetical protein